MLSEDIKLICAMAARAERLSERGNIKDLKFILQHINVLCACVVRELEQNG